MSKWRAEAAGGEKGGGKERKGRNEREREREREREETRLYFHWDSLAHSPPSVTFFTQQSIKYTSESEGQLSSAGSTTESTYLSFSIRPLGSKLGKTRNLRLAEWKRMNCSYHASHWGQKQQRKEERESTSHSHAQMQVGHLTDHPSHSSFQLSHASDSHASLVTYLPLHQQVLVQFFCSSSSPARGKFTCLCLWVTVASFFICSVTCVIFSVTHLSLSHKRCCFSLFTTACCCCSAIASPVTGSDFGLVSPGDIFSLPLLVLWCLSGRKKDVAGQLKSVSLYVCVIKWSIRLAWKTLQVATFAMSTACSCVRVVLFLPQCVSSRR